MAIKTTTIITCDDCDKAIIADGTTKTGYLNIENACPQNAQGEWATELLPAIPAALSFCDVECLKTYFTK
jgi:hypothetical protein